MKMQITASNITKCFIKYFNYPIILKNEYEARDPGSMNQQGCDARSVDPGLSRQMTLSKITVRQKDFQNWQFVWIRNIQELFINDFEQPI